MRWKGWPRFGPARGDDMVRGMAPSKIVAREIVATEIVARDRGPHAPTLPSAIPAMPQATAAQPALAAPGHDGRVVRGGRLRLLQAPLLPGPSMRHSTPLILPWPCPGSRAERGTVLALPRLPGDERAPPGPFLQPGTSLFPAHRKSGAPPVAPLVRFCRTFFLLAVGCLRVRHARLWRSSADLLDCSAPSSCARARDRAWSRRTRAVRQSAMKAMSRVTHASHDPTPLHGGWRSRAPAHRAGARRARQRVEGAVRRVQMRVQKPMH